MVSDFTQSIPAWRVAKLRRALREAEALGRAGDLSVPAHRALARRHARGLAIWHTEQSQKIEGRKVTAPRPRGPGTGSRRIAKGARLTALIAAVDAAFDGRDWHVCELRHGDLKRAHEATRAPMKAIGSTRPSYRRFVAWIHWRRAMGPLPDRAAWVGGVTSQALRGRISRDFGLPPLEEAGAHAGVVEGELVPALISLCRREKLTFTLAAPGKGSDH